MSDADVPGSTGRGVVLAVLWSPPLCFAVSAFAGNLPLSTGNVTLIKDVGVLLGALSILSVPLAMILTAVWWRRLPRPLQNAMLIVGGLATIGAILFILTFANPFFSG